MKACFMCDLHLPFFKDALQYDVMEWAISDILKKRPDCIAYAGDVACDGNEEVYDAFIDKMSNLGIPFIYIPGNSDLRCQLSKASIKAKASKCKNTVKGIDIYALNDCDMSISDEQFSELQKAKENSIVFMHHPIHSHKNDVTEKLLKWRENHKETMLFYGHLHYFKREENSVSLPPLDPDKAIGEPPCNVYYDTASGEIERSHYLTPLPKDFSDYFGISCYNTLEQIEFAIKNNLKCIEIRPNCIEADEAELICAINKWRNLGGENLSLHLPDVGFKSGEVTGTEFHTRVMKIVKLLRADRVTQHVPLVSVKEVKENKAALESICNYLSAAFNEIPFDITVGVENMHMTANDAPDDSRRFGYTPEECLQFMEAVSKKCRHKVGINFDIGHARNNAPFSQKYQISTWLAMVGRHIVGYHIHQVRLCENGAFKNHAAITNVYGCLISYASVFKCWDTARINKAPLIFEMSEENAYKKTLKCFADFKE